VSAGYDAKPAGATSCFIPADDRTSLYYRDWGSGRPVLFVHSWGFNADLWQYQMIHLTGHGLRCIAFDRRGHGRSSDPGRGYTCDRLADDLAAVIEQLDLRDLTLVGHSMGCAEIVRYLARCGAGRVSSLVLAAPSLPFRLKTPDNPDGVERSMVDDLCARMTSDLPQWLAENARPFFTDETSYPMAEWGMNVIMQSSLKALVECVRVAFETDLRADLPQIAVPTLILHGDNDVSAPLEQTGKRTAQLIPGSRLIVYEGAPHGLMFTHRQRLNVDLLAFLKS
jgi:pimeloyl-ACP methyl ester carboxylesterase